MQFTPGERVCIPALKKKHALWNNQQQDRCGIVESVETLSNGFQRIVVDFDLDTGLGMREIHPAHLRKVEGYNGLH